MKCLLDCWTMWMSEYFSAKNTNLIWTCSICYLNTNETTTLFCLLIFSVKGVFFMLQKQWWSFYVWGYFARKNQWGKQWWHRKRLAVFSGYLRNSVYLTIHFKATLSQPCSTGRVADHRPIRITQCCTQFKSPRVKILCVLYLHYNVAFTFKWYGNFWNKTFYSQRVWIGYNIELAK